MCSKGKEEPLQNVFSGGFPGGKLVIGVYVAAPKDSEWLREAKKKTKGIKAGSRLAECEIARGLVSTWKLFDT